jgi:hypothetical protein
LIGLLHHLEHQLADAAVGLAGLQEAVNRMQSWKPGWSRRRNATTAVAHAMEAELPATLTMQQRFAASNEISLAADLQVRRAEWAEGSMPEDYAFRVAFIHAHTVLYALDSIGKTIEVLARMGLPEGVATASTAFRSALPGLTDVRDSAHHIEDRARGLAKSGQPLDLRPVDSGALIAPDGRMLGLSNLNGNKLGYTANDGEYREIEISPASVAAAQEAIQCVLDAFTWTGQGKTVPN